MCKNPFQISFADGIFAFQPMFSYGQRSKCADLLNSYVSVFILMLSFLIAPQAQMISSIYSTHQHRHIISRLPLKGQRKRQDQLRRLLRPRIGQSV